MHRSRANEAYSSDRPLVNDPDFQAHHWSPSRRPSTPKPVGSPRLQDTGELSPLVSHQHWKQRTPTMSRSVPKSSLRTSIAYLPLWQYSRNDNRHMTSPREFVASSSASHVSATSTNDTYETHATSLELPALQTKTPLEQSDQMRPISGDLSGSFDLVVAPENSQPVFSLETRSEQLFSREHLKVLFSDPSLLLRFTAFLSTNRPQSVPVLIYYLDALKALKAIKYANAIAEALSPIAEHDFTFSPADPTANAALEEKAAKAFDVLVRDDLPAYITQLYIQVVSQSISRRITGTLAPHLREASEGLAEVFCLTDPSRPDNPIVFTSEGGTMHPSHLVIVLTSLLEFHRTTQYGVSYAIGRNCRFLQGPKTNPLSVKRLREAVEAGKEHCEVFLN